MTINNKIIQPELIEEVKDTPNGEGVTSLQPESVRRNSETVYSQLRHSYIENYKIVKILGKCESTLYLLENINTNEKAVLRVGRKKDYSDDQREEITEKISKKTYVKEIRHPNLIRFKEGWMDTNNFGFLEEYLEGKQLLDYLQDIEYNEKSIVEILK